MLKCNNSECDKKCGADNPFYQKCVSASIEGVSQQINLFIENGTKAFALFVRSDRDEFKSPRLLLIGVYSVEDGALERALSDLKKEYFDNQIDCYWETFAVPEHRPLNLA